MNCCATFAAIVDDIAKTPRERFLADVTALLRGLVDKRSSWNCDHQTVMPRTRDTPPRSAAGTWPGHDEREFDMAENGAVLYKPLGLLAELTHRCPLGCPYCSNPLALDPRRSELDTQTWARVFAEAAALGVLQVHLSGGEPGARRDLVAIMAAAHAAGLYTNLITSAVGVALNTLRQLAEAGLDHVQISIQDSERASAERIAGYEGAFARKCALAAEVVHLKIPLTVNAVMHRANIDHIEDMVALALALGASRVEIAHVQYYGWALKNRAALMPSAEQVKRAAASVEELRHRHHGKIVIDAVVPDYYARFPKPCVGGWGRRSLNVTPAGKVLPCHAAEFIPGLEFWSVREHSLADIWANSPAFNAFRGTAWMREPCLNCSRREIDFGGCRCQAFALTGDARATDPVCHLAPRHKDVAALATIRALRLSADVSGVARAIFAWAFPSFPFRRPSQRLKGVCLAWKPGRTEMFHRREDVWLVAINIHCHGCAPVADLRRSRLGELHGPTMRLG